MDQAHNDMTGALNGSRDWETGQGLEDKSGTNKNNAKVESGSAASPLICLQQGCKSAGKIFKRSYELERHNLIHFPSKKLICPIYQCKKKTKGKFHTRNDKFREHIASHGELALFCCPIQGCRSVPVKSAEFELHIANDHPIWERFKIKPFLDALRIDFGQGYTSCPVPLCTWHENRVIYLVAYVILGLCNHLNGSHSADELAQYGHSIAELNGLCDSYSVSTGPKLSKVLRDFTVDKTALPTDKTTVSKISSRGAPTVPSAFSRDHDDKLWHAWNDKENDTMPPDLGGMGPNKANLMGEDMVMQQSLIYDQILAIPQNFMPQNFMPLDAPVQLQSFIAIQEDPPMQTVMNPIPLVTTQTFNSPSILQHQSVVLSFIPPSVSLDVNPLGPNQYWHYGQAQNQFNPHEQAEWVWQPSLVENGNVELQQNIDCPVLVLDNMP